VTGPVAADALSSPLVEVLRCPICNESLSVGQDEVACRDRLHRFPVVQGVVAMTDEEAIRGNPIYRRQRRYFDHEFSRYRVYRLENWRVSYLTRLRTAGLLGNAEAPLLDVGVGGSGYTVIEAARGGGYAVGCDLSLEALLSARRFAEAEGVAGRTLWVCCSAEQLPLVSAAFASVLAIAVIEHVPNDLAAVREAARVLRPGGYLWVTVPHALPNISPAFRLPNRLHDRRLGHLRRYEPEALIEIGRSVGLTPVEVQFTAHPIKVLQLAAVGRLPASVRDRFWWWCEARDLRRAHIRKGSMQLTVLFRRNV
jgi:SAM-dependent methyltransferase